MNHDDIYFTPLDTQTLDPKFQMFKALIPYIDQSYRKNAALVVRFMELIETKNFFEQTPELSACGINPKNRSPEEILKDIQKYCMDNEAHQIEQILNILNMIKTYDKYKDVLDTRSDPSNAGGMKKRQTASGMSIDHPLDTLEEDDDTEKNPSDELIKTLKNQLSKEQLAMFEALTSNKG